MRVGAYIRISTVDQNSELQVREIQQFADRREWEVVERYQDILSGAKSRRPGLMRLMEDCRLRNLDCVCVWKLDRFGRSLMDCLNNINALERHGVRFVSITQGLDTDHKDPASRFMLHVLGAAAEFERTLIIERSKAGLKRYREDYEAGNAASRSGKNLAPHRPKRVFDREKVRLLRRQGLSLRQIANQMRIGYSTVRDVLRGERKVPPAKSTNRGLS